MLGTGEYIDDVEWKKFIMHSRSAFLGPELQRIFPLEPIYVFLKVSFKVIHIHKRSHAFERVWFDVSKLVSGSQGLKCSCMKER